VTDELGDYFVRIDETHVGRRAGGSASEKAQRLRAERPLRSLAGRVLGVRSDERAWRKGARGERFNGWLLDRLPSGWHAFHDIPVGHRGANIDHLVVGPVGVFTVNTKNVSGTVARPSDPPRQRTQD
jgi:nuclease-like protein